MTGYVTIQGYSSFEYEDRKSVFIGEAMPVETEAEALEFIERVKKHYSDANHHVYAYIIRDNSIMRFSDDREPQGTAGMPVLDSMRKCGCTNAVVVVTRYFGGTLLGTGGLVRAYTAASAGAISKAKLITYDLYSELAISCSYSDYQKISPVLASYGFVVEDTHFTDNVKIVGKIKKQDAEKLNESLVQISSAKAKVEYLAEKFDFV